MDVKDQVCVVTGGGNGIGAALCRAFRREGASHVYVVDREAAAAESIAADVEGTAVVGDVLDAALFNTLVRRVKQEHGRLDLFASNAGTTAAGGVDVSDEEWDRQWGVNVMSQVRAARAVLPTFLEQGHGYFLQTVSAAGVMTEIGSAAYSVTKHAAVALAEWLSVNYRRKGINVSVLCPAGVKTDFLDLEDPVHQFLHVSAVTPDEVAESAIRAIREKQFLVLPEVHEPVRTFFAYKGEDYDRWLHNFSRIAQRMERAAAKAARSRAATKPDDTSLSSG